MKMLVIMNLFLLLLGSRSEWALEDLRILAVSPEQERAVIHIPRHGQVLIEVGDELPGGSIEVVAVLAGRIVVEEVIEEDGEQRRVRAWIEPTGQRGGSVRVRRLWNREPSEAAGRPQMPRLVTFEGSAEASPGLADPNPEEKP